MTTIIVMNNQVLLAGAHAFGPVAIPSTVSTVTLIVDRTLWIDPSVELALTLDFSRDGVNWSSTVPSFATDPYPITITSKGGVLRDQLNNLVHTTITAVVPGGGETARAIRGTLTIVGGALTTTVTAQVN